MTGRQYTWTGSEDNPTYEKLDRVLVSTEWENNFPLAMVEARDWNISDHTPLVVSTGASTHQSGTRPLRFLRGSSLLERWQSKIRRLRQHLRGWASNMAGSYKKEKKTLLALLDNLDKKAENDRLTDHEINLKHYLKERLVSLLREEELKWYEKAKVKTLLEGDANTRFFHLVANCKHRKQHIYRLEVTMMLLLVLTVLKATLRIITKIYSGSQNRRKSP
jgi:hypothetical protein